MQYSIVQTTELDEIVFRLDPEFYHPEHLSLQAKLKQFDSISIRDAGGGLDCSAFYPSIVPYYNFEKEGVPFLRVNEIQNGLLNISLSTAFLPQEILDENPATIACCLPGDLIIAKGGNSLAKVAILTEEYQHYSVCRDVIVLRTNELTNVNRFYLWMFLHSSIGQKILLRTASQTGQPHLTLEAISQTAIPLLSNKFQSNFEWLYRESQRLKHVSEKEYDNAKFLLLSGLGLTNWQPKHQLTFIKNFGDTKSAGRIDAEHFHPNQDHIAKAINQKGCSSLLEELLSTCQRGKQPTYSAHGDCIVVNSKHVRSGEVIVDGDNRKGVVTEKSFLIKKGDVLLNGTGVGTIGRCAPYLHEHGAIPDNHVTILRAEGIDPIFLSTQINSIIGQMQVKKYQKGSSGQIELYPDDIKKFIIWNAPASFQKKIRDMVEEGHLAKSKSKTLLSQAKKAVELAIEQDEQTAMNWLKGQTG